MSNQDQQSGKKLIHTLGWIVGRTLTLTYHVLLAGFKIGLELIVNNLTHSSKIQKSLPPSRQAFPISHEPDNY